MILRMTVDVELDDNNRSELRVAEVDKIMEPIVKAAASVGLPMQGITVKPENGSARDMHIHVSTENENCEACMRMGMDEQN